MTALGMIETKGLVGAIEGADAMLKAASVTLLEKQLASGGLVTVTVAGEVAAVSAAVEAARVAIRRISGATLVTAHVIARPDKELERIVCLSAVKQESPKNAPTPAKTVLAESGAEKSGAEKTGAESKVTVANTPHPLLRYSEAQLNKMRLEKLRKLAQELGLSKNEIGKADKRVLLGAILQVYKQRADEE